MVRRTGTVPPITFPGIGPIVVPTATRAFIADRFSGVGFGPVDKVLVVRVEWENWDRAQPPAFLPAGGSPEGYILGHPHDPTTASEMPDLFELTLPQWGTAGTTMHKDATGRRLYNFNLKPGVGDPPDLFLGGRRFALVTDRGRELLESNFGEWVRFLPVDELPA